MNLIILFFFKINNCFGCKARTSFSQCPFVDSNAWNIKVHIGLFCFASGFLLSMGGGDV